MAHTPFIYNESPVAGSTGALSNIDISFYILDAGSDIQKSSINLYVDGDLAFDGVAFVSPHNGPDSYLGSVIEDGYDGYFIKIDSYNSYSGLISTQVIATDLDGYSLNESWGFIVGAAINTLYFSDGYGLKAIGINRLVGESEEVVRTVATSSTVPTIPANNITDIFGNWVRDASHLVLSYDQYQGYGAAIISNETSVNSYLDGYRTQDGQINNRGIMYIINKTLNRVEAYYGADFRDGYGRSPDYYYSTTSTPPIFHGEITCLHIESDASAMLASGTRLYIGTTLGFTRVDTYDAEFIDGYSTGLDGYGVANTYSIVGGGAMHEVIGGSVPQVTAVSANEEKSIIFAATNDNHGNGGLTQIMIEGNRKIIFMTKENNMLPSNDVRDIFGKEI